MQEWRRTGRYLGDVHLTNPVPATASEPYSVRDWLAVGTEQVGSLVEAGDRGLVAEG